MPETLLTPSSIKLFGRVVSSLSFTNDTAAGPGYNNFLQEQLAGKGAQFARIYGFSFEGAYYALPRPAMFLIHGPGNPVGNWDEYPSTLDQAGAAAREWDFSGNRNTKDIVYWEYEKGDFSIRLDMEAGPFEQILLIAALRVGADMADRATPQSGMGLAGRSGMGVSGMGVSGMGVSGMGVSGMGVSGMGLRNR